MEHGPRVLSDVAPPQTLTSRIRRQADDSENTLAEGVQKLKRQSDGTRGASDAKGKKRRRQSKSEHSVSREASDAKPKKQKSQSSAKHSTSRGTGEEQVKKRRRQSSSEDAGTRSRPTSSAAASSSSSSSSAAASAAAAAAAALRTVATSSTIRVAAPTAPTIQAHAPSGSSTSNQQPESHCVGTSLQPNAAIDVAGRDSMDGVDEGDVAKLVEMGFATAKVVQRLVANGGNFDAAMVALLSDTNDAEKQMNMVGDGEGGDGGAETMPSGMLELHFRIVLECIFWVA